jgi:hypothetical protein
LAVLFLNFRLQRHLSVGFVFSTGWVELIVTDDSDTWRRSAWTANSKMVMYVLDPATSEAGARWLRLGGVFPRRHVFAE